MNKLYYGLGALFSKIDGLKRYYRSHNNMKKLKVEPNTGTYISAAVSIAYPTNIYIGKNTYINGGDILASPNGHIHIGDNCLISYNVYMRTDMHNYQDKSVLINRQGHSERDIFIGNDVWIGFGVQIMPGVRIEDGSVIGAGAIVTSNTTAYGVYAGVPARKIKERL